VSRRLEKDHSVAASNVKETVEKTVCLMTNEKYVDGRCISCGVHNLDTFFDEVDDTKVVSYRRWIKIDNHVKKELIVTDLAEAKSELYLQLETFTRHSYNVKRQHRELNYLKVNLHTNRIILQEDFAENYTLKQQNEAMAAHWAPEQVTVFTPIVYYRHDAQLQHISFAIVSDEFELNKLECVHIQQVHHRSRQKTAKDRYSAYLLLDGCVCCTI
jgi:hypothetical protein